MPGNPPPQFTLRTLVCIKLLWLDMGGAEILIVGFSALSGTAVAASLAVHSFGG